MSMTLLPATMQQATAPRSALQSTSGRFGGGAEVTDDNVTGSVTRACRACGRPDDARAVLQLLQEEWLLADGALESLSDSGWQELRLPLRLKDELRREMGLADRVPFGRTRAGAKAINPTMISPAHNVTFVSKDSQEQSGGVQSKAVEEAMCDEVIALIREHVQHRSGSARANAVSAFKFLDRDHTGGMSYQEYEDVLQRRFRDLNLTARERKLVWDRIDTNKSGTIDLDEFIFTCCGGLNDRRRKAVRACFDFIERTHDGIVSFQDLKWRYDPTSTSESSAHHRVGARPPDEELVRFIEVFSQTVHSKNLGQITYEEFENYYDRISANIDNDEYFEMVLQRAWQLPDNWLSANPSRQGSGAQKPVGLVNKSYSGEQVLGRLRRAIESRKRGDAVEDSHLATLFKTAGGRNRMKAAVHAVQAVKRMGGHVAPLGHEGTCMIPALSPGEALRRCGTELSDQEHKLLKTLLTHRLDPKATRGLDQHPSDSATQPKLNATGFNFEELLHRLEITGDKTARRRELETLFAELSHGRDVLQLSRCKEVPQVFRHTFHSDLVSVEEFIEYYLLQGAVIRENDKFIQAVRRGWGRGATAAQLKSGKELEDEHASRTAESNRWKTAADLARTTVPQDHAGRSNSHRPARDSYHRNYSSFKLG
eukprot:TRINITY_DN27648_c0_g1_i1.p1 TRINITY_DN27648_c0_g1~~TRINITY_DN27648_c0_g1_i1.p1  ORF type:complete len:654 (-),score=101.45 TRINITY_DN27648_c0_g1_i1:19-1980(-)